MSTAFNLAREREEEYRRKLRRPKGSPDPRLIRARYHTRLARKNYVKQCNPPIWGDKAAGGGRNPQAVVTVARDKDGHYNPPRGFQVFMCMKYVARIGPEFEEHEELELEDQDGVKIKGLDEIRKEYERWSKTFERNKPGSEKMHRHADHLFFSADCEHSPGNLRKVEDAARAVLASEINAAGFDYVFALHSDGERPHVHVVVRCKNRHPREPKFRHNQDMFLHWRERFAQELTARGLAHDATLRVDRPSVLERVEQGLTELRKKYKQHKRKLARETPAGVDFLEDRWKQEVAIAKLKEFIKNNTKEKSKVRLKAFAEVRRYERQLKKERTGQVTEREACGTLLKIGADVEEFEQQAQVVVDRLKDKEKRLAEGRPEPGFLERLGQKVGIRPAEERKHLLERDADFIAASIKRAFKAINESNLPMEKKKAAAGVLNRHWRNVEAALGYKIVTRKEIKEYARKAVVPAYQSEPVKDVMSAGPGSAFETILAHEAKDIAAVAKSRSITPALLRHRNKAIEERLNRPLRPEEMRRLKQVRDKVLGRDQGEGVEL